MNIYVTVDVWYFSQEPYCPNFGHYSMAIKDNSYFVSHELPIGDAEKELHKLEDKLGCKATEKEENGVRHLCLGGYIG